jgi:soluble P-type ATPase
MDENTLLSYAASADRYSEHPLADALRRSAQERGIALREITNFESLTGMGVRATVDGKIVSVGRNALMDSSAPQQAKDLEAQGKTVLFVSIDHALAGFIAASDTLRNEVPEALQEAKRLGIKKIELLTGDNERVASSMAGALNISYRAALLPEDKIRIVKEYQSQGHIVVMAGDGINDAPALAQADVGIAMKAGSDVAIEAAHITLLREDWMLIPQVIAAAQRTMRVVKGNLGFTAAFNVVGLTLAAFGFLPPMLAAALQSIPDLRHSRKFGTLVEKRQSITNKKETACAVSFLLLNLRVDLLILPAATLSHHAIASTAVSLRTRASAVSSAVAVHTALPIATGFHPIRLLLGNDIRFHSRVQSSRADLLHNRGDIIGFYTCRKSNVVHSLTSREAGVDVVHVQAQLPRELGHHEGVHCALSIVHAASTIGRIGFLRRNDAHSCYHQRHQNQYGNQNCLFHCLYSFSFVGTAKVYIPHVKIL